MIRTLLILLIIGLVIYLIMRSRSRRSSPSRPSGQIVPELGEDNRVLVPDPTDDTETHVKEEIEVGEGSPVQAVLAANIGCPAWVHGRVIRLRARSDAVIDSVDESSVSLRRMRDDSVSRLSLRELDGVALPKSKPGAELGHPIPGDGAKECDMVLVSDKPFESAWQPLADGNSYFWRSSTTEQLASRMTTRGMIMFAGDDESSKQEAASDVIEVGMRILRLEPDHQDAYCFYLLGSAQLRLQNFGEARSYLERASELQSFHRSLDEYSEKALKRDLGTVLAILAVQTHDADLRSKAVALLDELELSPDDPLAQILARLRG